MKPATAWSLARETMTSWSNDYASSMGAALAYYTMFSIAPLLLIVISVAGLFFGEQAARGEILDQLQGLMGVDGAQAVYGQQNNITIGPEKLRELHFIHFPREADNK